VKSLHSSRPPKDVDTYLASVPKEARAALGRLRKIIRATAPKATETISYGIPTYKYRGMLVAFAAFKNHCSFFPGAAAVKANENELKPYGISKGTIRFPADTPLPAVLVKRLVKARIKENEARSASKRR